MASPSAVISRIHQALAKVWVYCDVPAAGAVLPIDANGNPIPPTAGYTAWVTATQYVRGAKVKDAATPANTLLALSAGTSGAAEPTTPTNVGDMVGDGVSPSAFVWENCGPYGASFIGATDAATTITSTPKIEAIAADQAMGPIGVRHTGEAMEIDVTLKESDLAKLSKVATNSSLGLFTDTGLPAGAQNISKLTFGGGPVVVPTFSVAVVSPRIDVAGKFVVSQIYYAYQKSAVKLPIEHAKETTYKVTFEGIFGDLTRAAGDQLGCIWRQL
jgi:hypothetical protein